MGSRAGDEVVQLYLRDLYASMARPVKELAGFKRITLEPGEKQTVIFEVKASQMAFLDMNMQWKVEKGTFLVEGIGAALFAFKFVPEFRKMWQNSGILAHFCNKLFKTPLGLYGIMSIK